MNSFCSMQNNFLGQIRQIYKCNHTNVRFRRLVRSKAKRSHRIITISQYSLMTHSKLEAMIAVTYIKLGFKWFYYDSRYFVLVEQVSYYSLSVHESIIRSFDLACNAFTELRLFLQTSKLDITPFFGVTTERSSSVGTDISIEFSDTRRTRMIHIAIH